MNVILVEPCFPANQREFARALHAVGARVIGIGERPSDWLDDELRHWLSDYIQIPSVVSERHLEEAVRHVQSKIWVDRLEATVEAHIMPAAKVRARCTIPGTTVETAFLCRDKPAMKQALREAGISCAQSTGAASAAEVRDFADSVGFPLIIKPRDAAGAAGTYKAGNAQELEVAIRESGAEHGSPVAVEEFIEGHEGFLDTITIDGEVAHEFVTHYYPNVLEAMRKRPVAPQMIATNRLFEDSYAEVRSMARQVIKALGIETSATHMEWFFGPKGLKFSEIGCRPPGVCQWDVYCAANEFDIYREWAAAIVHSRALSQPSRNYSCGMIALRPDRDGRIVGYEGEHEVGSKYGANIVAAHLPPPGTRTQPVEAGYMANAWMRVRHPDYDALRGIMNDIGNTLKVRAR